MDTQQRIDKLFHWAAIAAWLMFVLTLMTDLAHAQAPADEPHLTSPWESRAHIEQVASDYAVQQAGGGRVSVRAQLPDRRLRLPRCPEPLQAQGLTRGQRLQVQVSCTGRWKLYVPVTMQQEKQLIVARRSLQTDAIVAAADLDREWRALKGSGYGHFESVEAVIGRRVARPIMAGQIITPGQLRQAFSVHKGDLVTLVSRIGNVEIRGRGRAENDALENTRVRVRNLSSGRLVEGYVRADGLVEIRG